MAPHVERQNHAKRVNKKQKAREKEAAELADLIKKYDQIEPSAIKTFDQFPLTSQTQKALKEAKYKTPTEIQRISIGYALKGKDILGAAKTGSGKTLAFIIPILECLYREKWTRLDGLGALVITPTRELAYQIFKVLKKVGVYHTFSAALVIGGKDLKFERERLHKCNIIICTPGRLLQHLDENPLFEGVNLKILVLDEADRILDAGFKTTMNAIIESLPEERQTLLFSATQTKSVKDLARLSLNYPQYVSDDAYAKSSTPESLQQSYITCEAHEKMNLLWSFLKSHRKQKILVFMSSCKQVKYAFDIFCRMKPGMSVLALYGSLHQLKRMAIYDRFHKTSNIVLFATDIAARGLDFPSVNWVVQLDCPEDVNTYIHRAGRTARYHKGGEALLVLLPSEEEAMLKELESRKIPINKIFVDPKKLVSVQRKMEALCARDVALKETAQRAFKAYLKSIVLMKNKSVFDVNKVDKDAYARSLGLPFAPRQRFIEKCLKEKQKDHLNSECMSESHQKESIIACKDKPYSETALEFDKHDDSDDDFLIPKKVSESKSSDKEENVSEEEIEEEIGEKSLASKKKKPLTKAAVVKKIIRKKIKVNSKVIFDEEGKMVEEFPRKQKTEIANELGEEIISEGYSIEKAKLIMQEEDKFDKQLYQKKVKEKHREKRLKEKTERIKEQHAKEVKLKEFAEDKEVSENESGDGDDIRTSALIDALPDPEKFYGGQSEEDINDDPQNTIPTKAMKSGESSSEDNESNEIVKRKKKHRKEIPRKKIKSGSSKVKLADTGLTLADEEELALHLLSQS